MSVHIYLKKKDCINLYNQFYEVLHNILTFFPSFPEGNCFINAHSNNSMIAKLESFIYMTYVTIYSRYIGCALTVSLCVKIGWKCQGFIYY